MSEVTTYAWETVGSSGFEREANRWVPSLNSVVYLIGCSLVSERSLCMHLGGIGVFIKLIHGERVTQGGGVCGTQRMCLMLNPHAPTVLFIVCSVLSVL